MRLFRTLLTAAALVPTVLLDFACSTSAPDPTGGASPEVVGSPSEPGTIAADECRTVGQKSECTYKQVEGVTLQADVYRAPGDEVRPAVVWIHGGALIMGHRNWLERDQLEVYRRAGYVVISIDYRLAPETSLEKIHEDVADAWKWIRERGAPRFKFDPDRIALVGHSAGGYLTLTSGFRLSPRPKALVSFYGYGDMTGPWYSNPAPIFFEDGPISEQQALRGILSHPIPHSPAPGTDDDKRFDFYVYCRQKGLWPKKVSGHDPATEPGWFKPYEAIQNVGPDYPPTILLHGHKDDDVPFEQSKAMAAKLEEHHVDHELVENPSWGHGFDDKFDDPAVKDAFAKVVRFLGRHL